jgi:hypothetical protein
MYFIVNAGISEAKQLPLGVNARRSRKGDKPAWTQYVEDKDISRFNAFFVEADDSSIEEQLSRVESCPVAPSIVILTKKSVHAYWLCLDGIARADWVEVQKRLIGYFKSDYSIKNPSRVMRLPFFNHVVYNASSQEMEYKRVGLHRFEPDLRYSDEDLKAAFPAVTEVAHDWTPPPVGDGEYRTWEDLGNELRRRMAAHPTAHRQGDKIVLRGECHNGKGDSALFFNTVTGKYHCDNDGCGKEDILRAFGLPEKPADEWRPKVFLSSSSKVSPLVARNTHITDSHWSSEPSVAEFISRKPQLPAIVVEAAPVPECDGESCPVCSAALATTYVADFLAVGCPVAGAEHYLEKIPEKKQPGHCSDCDEWFDDLKQRFCFTCSELRKFHSNELPCACWGVNRWRYRDGGFKWHCGKCEQAPTDAVWSWGRSLIKESYGRNH